MSGCTSSTMRSRRNWRGCCRCWRAPRPTSTTARRILRLGVAGATLLHMLASADRYAGRLDADEYRDEVVGTITSILTGLPAR